MDAKLTLPAVPEQVAVGCGKSIRLEIGSAAGAGYRWELSPISGGLEVASLRIVTEPLEHPPIPDNRPASTFLHIEGKAAGTAVWRLKLVRPWMPEAVLADHRVTVTVT